jgi:hypothetical protein
MNHDMTIPPIPFRWANASSDARPARVCLRALFACFFVRLLRVSDARRMFPPSCGAAGVPG